MSFQSLITPTLSYGTLILHIILIVVIGAFIFRKSWGRSIVFLIGKHAILIGLLVTIGAVTGSLLYSEVIGYEPCVLCWWQRVFIYPCLILFLVALKKKDWNVFNYVLPLSIMAGIIGLYQSYANLSGNSILPCTAQGGACSKVYVLEFGYITIPIMSLTIAISLIVISLVGKYYAKNNSNS